MPQKSLSGRILAISVRSQRLGFAIIDGSVELIHWGIIYYEKNETIHVVAATKRVAVLIERFTPSVFTFERSKAAKALNPENLELLYRNVRRVAPHPSVRSLFTRAEVRQSYRDFGVQSKDDIAALLARMFPELQPNLPPKRRLWESEHSSMPMFDAVALAVAYWRRECFQE